MAASCGSTAGTTPNSTSTTTTTSATSGTTASGAATSYTLTANGTTSSSTVSNAIKISSGGSAALSIAVVDSNAAAAPDGTVVTFSISDSTLGSLSASAASVKTGVASVTFTGAASKTGTETVTATSGTSTTTIDIIIQPTYTVTVTSTPSTLSLGGTASLSATVIDSASANAPDGTSVAWSINDSNLGTITATSTTVSGLASATFNASTTTSGTVTITATVGSYSNIVDIIISPAATGSIVFTSATPQIIGVKGGGQSATSVVVFSVADINGNPVADGQKIDICMKGPSGGRLPSAGGEYVGNLVTVKEAYTDANGNGCYDTGETFTDSAGGTTGVYDSPNYAQVSTVGGKATITLQSGDVAGNITLFATVVGKSLSTAAPTISVGGGVPTDKSFTVAASKLNLPGYNYSNRISTLSVYLADRFGNANVLTGTAVNFYTNAGATVSSTGTLDAQGKTSVDWRTQNPTPPAGTYMSATEQAVVTAMNTKYGTPTTINPHDGSASILVTVVGEEDFYDLNGNGLYDAGEPFTDTLPEPFIDSNGNGVWDDGITDLWEQYIDVNGNGAYDGTPNAAWDSSKVLYRQINLLYTGSPKYVRLKLAGANGALPSTGAFAIANNTIENFTLLVADRNLNILTAGTTVTVSISSGTLAGTSTVTVGDTNVTANPTEMNFSVSTAFNASPVVTQTVITVTIVHEGVTYTYSWNGTVAI